MTATVTDFGGEVRELWDFFERNVAAGLAIINSTGDAEAIKRKATRESQEAHSRKYLVDGMMKALGWDLNNPHVMIVEEEIAPLPSGGIVSPGESRFIDYHGRDYGDPSSVQSLLLVEAKRISASLPNVQSIGVLDHSRAFADALGKRLEGHNVPAGVTKAWAEWLDDLIDYAKRVKNVYGHAPRRAVITNGNWYVVFLDCEAALISGPPSIADILVFHDLGDVLARAREFRSALAYEEIRNTLPAQHPSQLLQFATQGERLPYTVAARIEYKPFGRRQPLLAIQISVWVRTTSRGWLLFQLDFDDDFIPLRSGTDDLSTIFAELTRRRDLLLKELRKYVDLDLVPTEAFAKGESAEAELIGGVNVKPERLVSLTRDRHYLLAVGQHVAHINNDTAYDACSYHAHGPCLRDGFPASGGPILKPTVSPMAFFPSGSSYHCAHRSVHEQRATKCLIMGFERFLCCRRCVFFNVCWPDGGSTLPCEKA